MLCFSLFLEGLKKIDINNSKKNRFYFDIFIKRKRDNKNNKEARK